MLPRELMAAGARMVVLITIVVLLLVTAWMSLVAAVVVVLRPVLGFSGALFVIAIAMVSISAFVVLVAYLARGRRPVGSGTDSQGVRLTASVVRLVSSGLSKREDLRFLLIGVALLAAGLAVGMPPGDTKSRD